MGRYLPTECEHGTTIDWGDFGSCQDCDEHGDDPCPNLVDCAECDAGDDELINQWMDMTLAVIRRLNDGRRK